MKKRNVLIAVGLTLCLGLSGCGEPAQEETTVISETPAATREQITEATTAPQGQPTQPPQEIPNNDKMLLSAAEPVEELTAVKRDHYDNGTYYYSDINEDGSLRTISSSYVTTLREGESEEDYASRRAIGLSASITPGTPYQLTVVHNEEVSETLGYPVYMVNYFTGSDDNTLCWVVFLTHTEHYSYQYAFAAEAQKGIQMEETFTTYFETLQLEQMQQEH